jgi:hypothetical protein
MGLAKQELEMVAGLISNLNGEYSGELSYFELIMVGGGFGDAILA